MRKSLPDEDLLDRLEEIFARGGYRAVTVSDLAAALGCSRRRLYEFAEGKEALFLFVMGRFFERLRREGRRRADLEIDYGDRIRAFLSVSIEEARRISNECLVDFEASSDGRALFARHQALRIGELKGILEGGIAAGTFRPVCPQLIAEMLLFAVMRARQPEFQREAGVTFADALADLSLVMREGFRTDGPPDAAREKTFSRTFNLLLRSNTEAPVR